MNNQEAIKTMHNLNMVLSITPSEREAVNMAIAALEEQQRRRWIPVEERLPEVPKENPVFDGKELELYLVTSKTMKAYNEMEKTNLELNDLLMRQNRFLIEQIELLRKCMSKTGEVDDE